MLDLTIYFRASLGVGAFDNIALVALLLHYCLAGSGHYGDGLEALLFFAFHFHPTFF